MEQTEGDFIDNELPYDVKGYLLPSKQTEITTEIVSMVEGVVNRLEGNTIQKAQQILEIMKTYSSKEEFNEEEFRKRTASEIIKSGYYTGCTDFALAFTLLARKAKIPTMYVETVSEEWLKHGGDSYGGHVYAKIYDSEKNEWIWVDPMQREVPSTPPDNPTPEQEKRRGIRIILAEGKDSWDIGISDFTSLKEKFNTFRNEWNSKRDLSN